MMLQGELLDPCRTSLRLERGGKFPCLWVLPLVKSAIFGSLSNNPHQTYSKLYGIQFQCVRHPSSSQWTLMASRRGLQKSIMKTQFSHVCFPILFMWVFFYWGSTSILLSTFRLKNFTSYPNLITSTLRLLDLLKSCWNDDIFVSMPSLWSGLLP